MSHDSRPWNELRSSGLLWLINATVFHPRGFALAFVMDDDAQPIGWRLVGDGREPWRFETNMDDLVNELFRAAEATLKVR